VHVRWSVHVFDMNDTRELLAASVLLVCVSVSVQLLIISSCCCYTLATAAVQPHCVLCGVFVCLL
jgi:hypothetical protein